MEKAAPFETSYKFLRDYTAFSALQAGRSRVRFPMGSLGFFIDLILPVSMADNLANFMCRLSRNTVRLKLLKA
jgi:hypothetical protein